MQKIFFKFQQIKEIATDSLLITLDVKFIYAKIPNNEGMKAVKETYEKHLNETV